MTLFSFVFSATAAEMAPRLLIIDTAFKDPYAYRTTQLLAHSVSFAVTIKELYDVSADECADYQAVLISFDAALLQKAAQEIAGARLHSLDSLESMETAVQHPLVKHLFSLLIALRNMNNKVIILAFPAVQNIAGPIAQLTRAIVGAMTQTTEPGMREAAEFVQGTLAHVQMSDGQKSYRYHTTLFPPRAGSYQVAVKKPLMIDDRIHVAQLPSSLTFFEQHGAPLRPLYPLGLYLFHGSSGNRYVITNTNYLLCTAIDENFRLNPMDDQLRMYFLRGMQQFWSEIAQMVKQESVASGAKPPPLPQELTVGYRAQQKERAVRERHVEKQYQWIAEHNGIACGWTHLNSFFEKKNDQLLLKDGVVERLLASGLTMLWLQLTPELFISKNASADHKREKDEFYDKIKQFTQALASESRERAVDVPKLFVGFEISWNAADVKNVINSAQDLYGTTYPNIPSPLDFDNYWRIELIDVFKQFCQDWTALIGSGLSLAGIFLDLEMYHAPTQASEYTDLMDFSSLSWSQYGAARALPKDVLGLSTPVERFTYMFDKKLIADYRAFLYHAALNVGAAIKDAVYATLPAAIIGVYAPVIPISWFYRGFLAGLSSARRPLILATFNNDYFGHYPWLHAHHIYAYHLPVLLFSKLGSADDFAWIEHYFNTHDGVWFNRYARLEEQKPATQPQLTVDVEISPLPRDVVIKLMRQAIEAIKRK